MMKYLLMGLGMGLAHPATAQVVLHGQRAVGLPRDLITVTVTFATAPTSASSTFAVLKYDKLCAMSCELDDNSIGTKTLMAVFDGGVASDGATYARKTFTDGCGNPVPYRAGLAVNGRNGYNNVEQGLQSTTLSYTQTAAMIARDWSLENHGYYHEASGNFNLGRNFNLNLRVNQQFWYDKLAPFGIQYVMRTMVVPSGNSNYVKAADSLRYIAAASQGNTGDGYPIWPATGQNPVTVESVPAGYAFYARWLGDQWGTATQLTNFKAQLDLLLSSSSTSTHKLWRWFSHDVVLPNIATFADYVQSQANDRLWVVGLQEYAEYHEVKRAVIKKETLTGNTLTITLDLTRVSPANRFRDMSLLIKSAGGAAIQSVNVTNADHYTYNSTTGLINIFKKKTTGFAGAFPH